MNSVRCGYHRASAASVFPFVPSRSGKRRGRDTYFEYVAKILCRINEHSRPRRSLHIEIIGAPDKRFDALARSHTGTESNRINILVGPLPRSSIKTLPATLPEPGQRPNPCSGGSLLTTTRLFMGTPDIAGPDLELPPSREGGAGQWSAHTIPGQCIKSHGPKTLAPVSITGLALRQDWQPLIRGMVPAVGA